MEDGWRLRLGRSGHGLRQRCRHEAPEGRRPRTYLFDKDEITSLGSLRGRNDGGAKSDPGFSSETDPGIRATRS